jgi:hypothetical protein
MITVHTAALRKNKTRDNQPGIPVSSLVAYILLII